MSISAMKQALEALEGLWDDGFGGVPESMHKDAIAALRQAIAEAEKREWVGLTDEEIYDYADKFLYQHGSNYGIKSFGKAIEAKLKEKNT
jgi:hypothetical protein